MNKLIIGSRGSKLAIRQTQQVMEVLVAVHPQIEIEIQVIRTQGDLQLDKPIEDLGGKSAFTTEIESALLNREIDLAVHSLKDLPTNLPDELLYLGSPEREDARDVLISKDDSTIEDIPENGIIATGSVRRKAQILSQRPDIQIENLRGNVDTRLKKLDENKWNGIITAAAAMHRLNLKNRISQYLDPKSFVPAGGQGALAIEILSKREDLHNILSSIIDEDTTMCCLAERIFLSKIGGDCFTPIGCYAEIDEKQTLRITGYTASIDGKNEIKETVQGKSSMARTLALQLFDIMIKNGAKEIIHL